MSTQNIWNEELRVRTFECDFQQRWKPAHFLQAMTEAASDHAAHLGVGFSDLQSKNMVWVLSRVKLIFTDRPRVGQVLNLRTWPRGIEQKLFFRRDFELLDRGGTRVAAAATDWLLVDPQERRLRPPQMLDRALPPNDGLCAVDGLLEKIVTDAPLEQRLVRTVSYSQVDMLGHANSARYLEWICDCFNPADFSRKKLSWLQINYSSELKPGETVAIHTGESRATPGLFYLEGLNQNSGARAFDAALQWENHFH